MPILFKINALKGIKGISPTYKIPLPVLNSISISGVTRDGANNILGSCIVELFRTKDDVKVDTTTSDVSTGIYNFYNVSIGQQYYAVAYKIGSPDLSGTTINTLTGT